ncbi:MAG: serine hydrolase [bacterium]
MIAKVLVFTLLLFPGMNLNLPEVQTKATLPQAESLDNDAFGGGFVKAAPVKTGESLGVLLSGEEGLIFDVDSKTVLFSKNENQPRAMASTTKLMTVLLLMDSEKSLDEVVTISGNVSKEGSDVALSAGEEVRASDLLKAALIASANDAALAISEFVAPDTITFVNMMNEKTKELGMKNTVYKNPTGLDEEGHVSSAYDITILMNKVLEYEDIRNAINTKEASVYILNSNRVINLQNTNELLGSDLEIFGGKTGYTEAAKRCLTTVTDKNGHRLIVTVMGSTDAFHDTRALIEWTHNNFTWK